MPKTLTQNFALQTIFLSLMTVAAALIHNGSDMQHFLSGMTVMAYLAALAAWIDGGIDLTQFGTLTGGR